jgi:tyrosyl-tRNA synthetase
LTALVHGEEEAKKAQDAAKALFVGGGDMSNVPTTTITAEDLNEGVIGVLDLMMKCKLAPSKKEARRLVEQGGVEVNGEKVAAATVTYTADDLAGEGLMIKKGKKVFHRAQM